MKKGEKEEIIIKYSSSKPLGLGNLVLVSQRLDATITIMQTPFELSSYLSPPTVEKKLYILVATVSIANNPSPLIHA